MSKFASVIVNRRELLKLMLPCFNFRIFYYCPPLHQKITGTKTDQIIYKYFYCNFTHEEAIQKIIPALRDEMKKLDAILMIAKIINK